jgi:DNA-binding NarL/FixJ family response regulator
MLSSAASTASAPAAFATLPARLKVLFFAWTDGGGQWLADAFAADGAVEILLQQSADATTGLTQLRDEVFDAILVTHEPPGVDGLELVEAIRAGGSEEPLIVLGRSAAHEMDALAYEAGADEYCCLTDTTVRGLLWMLARATQRYALTRENRRLLQAERQRLQHEHHEAERLLEQQRGLIEDLQQLSSPPSVVEASGGEQDAEQIVHPALALLSGEKAGLDLPAPLVDHYRELLRAYVIMGAGNLACEMSALAELLAASDITAQKTLQLHVEVLEELIQGLGNRSARHVMNRADLLALEVMGHLADRYRQRAVDGSGRSENRRGGEPVAGFGAPGLRVGESLRDSLVGFTNVLPRIVA